MWELRQHKYECIKISTSAIFQWNEKRKILRIKTSNKLLKQTKADIIIKLRTKPNSPLNMPQEATQLS